MFDNNKPGWMTTGGGAVSVLLLSSLQTVSAAEAPTADEATQLRFEIQQLKLINENQAQMLKEMENRLYRLESPQQSTGSEPSKSAQQDTASTSEPRKKEAGPSASVENVLQAEHALFTDKFTVEVGLNYSHYDRKDLVLEGFLALDAIFLGDISVDDVKADIFTFDVTGRYNVTDRWQVGATLPFVYRNTNFQRNVNGGVEADVNEAGLGDITLSSAYQIHQETTDWPDVVWNLSVRAPTGTDPYGTPTDNTKGPDDNKLRYPVELPTGSGIWSISNGLSFLKTTDPAILFANIGYTYNFDESFDDISSSDIDSPSNDPGEVRLGDSLYYGVGMAFALNERMSLSMSLSQRISMESEIKNQGEEWQEVIGSDGNAATFSTGVTYALSDKRSMSASVGIGLTPDASDFSFALKFPYRF